MKTLLSAENQAIFNRLSANREEGSILVSPKATPVKNPTSGVIVKSPVQTTLPSVTQVAPTTQPATVVQPALPAATTTGPAPSMPQPEKKPVPLVLLAGGALLLYFFLFRK